MGERRAGQRATTRLDDAVHRIRTGPQGPAVGAFFDFDGTVVHGFSGVHFFRKLHRRSLTTRELARTILAGIRGEKSDADVAAFIEQGLLAWRGRTEREMDHIGDHLFTRTIAGHLYPEAWQLIRAHEAAGHTIVIASSASRFQVEPAADELGIDHVLHTEMEVSADGELTGRVAGPMLWRDGKADAVRRFAAERGIDLTSSYGYSNGGEDEPFLSLVAMPTAVNPDARLDTVADERGWPRLRFRPRGRPGPTEIARTLAGFGALLAGVLAGVLSAVRSGDRRRTVSRLLVWGSGAALRGTGVRIRVHDAHNAEQARPAVFVFNHQSQFDIIVLAHVLRHDVTGVAKREIVRNPVFGPIFRFVGVTFIDRSDSASAIAALRPVVDTLRSGTSVAIAPEGHRSLTPRLLPFKKGAFHLAMQAGVPVVPVVIHNAGEVLWRNWIFVRPGTIDVTVCEPIDVSAWDPANLDTEIEHIRQLVTDTLTGVRPHVEGM